MFFVTHPGSTLHGRGGKPPCAAAHGIASESKGHDSRARGFAAGVIFAAKNDRVWGKTNFFFFAVSLPTIGGFLEQRGAWVRNGKPAPSKKGREAQYLNQPP